MSPEEGLALGRSQTSAEQFAVSPEAHVGPHTEATIAQLQENARRVCARAAIENARKTRQHYRMASQAPGMHILQWLFWTF